MGKKNQKKKKKETYPHDIYILFDKSRQENEKKKYEIKYYVKYGRQNGKRGNR